MGHESSKTPTGHPVLDRRGGGIHRPFIGPFGTRLRGTPRIWFWENRMNARLLGIGLALSAAHLAALGSFALAAPTIGSVSGCLFDIPPTTAECARTGGDVLTLTGTGFADGAVVSVAGQPCGDVQVLGESLLNCSLPAGVGRAGVLVTVAGELSNTLDLYYEGYPRVDESTMRSGGAAPENPISIASTLGGSVVIVDGVNLAPGAPESVELFIDGRPCARLQTCADGEICSSDIECDFGACAAYGFTLACSAPPGAGVNQEMLLRYVDSSVPYIEEVVLGVMANYPPPNILPASFRLEHAGSGELTVALACNDGLSEMLYFDGENFGPDPSEIIVTVGPSNCAVDPSATTDTTIGCLVGRTTDHSVHGGVGITVEVGGQSTTFDLDPVWGAPPVIYPPGPRLTSISGCVDEGASTIECPTIGEVDLWVTGENFSGSDLVLASDSAPRPCMPISSTVARCLLPPGSGVVSARLRAGCRVSDTMPLAYAPPSVISVAGCQDQGNGTENCPAGGSALLTISGSNFGPQGAQVLVGDRLCANVQHDPADPHGKLTCELPSGSGNLQAVRVLTAAGSAANGSARVGYEGCAPGAYDDGSECLACAPGTYSDAADRPACTPCAEGTFAGEFGATSCQPCAPGHYAAIGQAACLPCPAGMFSSGPAASSCEACPPGSFSDQLGTTECQPCPEGSSTSVAGASACSPCEEGRFQDQTGARTCQPCPAGTFQNATGATACVACEPGTAQPDHGQGGCLPCLNGTSARGAIRCTDPLKCRKVRDASLPRFVSRTGVSLDDLFSSETVVIQKPDLLCSPAALDHGDVLEPTSFRCCYKVKGSAKSVASPRIQSVDVFGALIVRPNKKTGLLCEPCTVAPR